MLSLELRRIIIETLTELWDISVRIAANQADPDVNHHWWKHKIKMLRKYADKLEIQIDKEMSMYER